MRAIVGRRYGPPDEVLDLDQAMPEPSPGPHDVLVELRAASINAVDWHLVRGEPVLARASFGLRRPAHPVPGADLAGVVREVGAEVTTVAPGDEVFGTAYEQGYGAFAELARVPESVIAPKPAGLTWADAAALPLAGSTALQAVRDHGALVPGQRVLVLGASGGVGSFVVQVAAALGAEVTAATGPDTVGLVRELGADLVVDRTREDPLTAAGRHDLVVQLGGTDGASRLRQAATPDGTVLLLSGQAKGRIVGPIARLLSSMATAPFVSQTIRTFTVAPNADDLRHLAARVERGEVRPVVARTVDLADVPKEVRASEVGTTAGKVVVAF